MNGRGLWSVGGSVGGWEGVAVVTRWVSVGGSMGGWVGGWLSDRGAKSD